VSEGAVVIVPVGGGARGGKYGILTGVLTGGKRERPWQGKAKIARLLGLPRKAIRAALRAGEGTRLKQAARATYLTSRAETLLSHGKPERAARFVARAQRDAPAGTLTPTTVLPFILESLRRQELERAQRKRPMRPRSRPGTVPTLPVIYSTQPRTPTLPVIYSTQPRTPAPPPPDVPEWMQVLAILRDWWWMREQQREALREARRTKKEQTMALGDFISGLGGALSGALTTVTPAVTAIYNERAARSLARAGMTGASGVPLTSSLTPGIAGPLMGAAAGLLLGEEPDILAPGGILESLGLEGDIERTATFWRKTASGFRPVMELNARHPTTGRIGAWTYRGRPLMYTRDLAICRDVGRVARRAASRTGLRFRRRGR